MNRAAGHAYIKIGPDDLIAHTVEFREAAGCGERRF
ncbi:UNVERIFIED_CONTAM: hypothetical protein ABIC26_003407 [Paenibacillus sp. PvR008]